MLAKNAFMVTIIFMNPETEKLGEDGETSPADVNAEGEAEAAAAMEANIAEANDSAVAAEVSHAQEVAELEGDLKSAILSNFEAASEIPPTEEEVSASKRNADAKVGNLYGDLMYSTDEARPGIVRQMVDEIGKTGEYDTPEIASAIESGDAQKLATAVNQYRNARHTASLAAQDAKTKMNDAGPILKGFRKLFGKK